MSTQPWDLHDDGRTPPSSELLDIVQRGLQAHPKRLPSWLFYDEQGSALFERICEQPEYYLTDCEISLLEAQAAEMAATLGSDVRLVEYGSGSAVKTGRLLAQMLDPVCYVPVEISPEPLRQSVERLRAAFPHVAMQPLCANFNRALRLPIPPRAPRRTVLYFPGSTIGNFPAPDAVELLRKMRGEMGENGGILIGVDLKKDPAVIEAAYNDRAGITAAFTLNMLARLNRELGTAFDLDRFRHQARYNPLAGRVETSLVSTVEQKVRVGRMLVRFAEGEPIHVEVSCKYAPEEFAALAARAGLEVRRVWTDARGMFSVQYLVRAGTVVH